MKSIKNIKNLKNKNVLVRVDFNVPINNGKIEELFRIEAVLPTIKYLIKKKAKIILISHLGRPIAFAQSKKSKIKNKKFSLEPIAKYLSKLLKKNVKFIGDCIGENPKKEISKMKRGEVVLLENLRFYKGEEKNDINFAKELAKLADIYINDAFAVSHRVHASVEAITKFLPSFAGFLLEKEIKVLSSVFQNPRRPLCLVMGGVKLETKLPLIRKFISVADNIIIGGALANTLLLAQKLAVGKSFVEKKYLKELKPIKISDSIFHLPVDVRVSESLSGKKPVFIKAVGKIKENEIILDIGPETEKLFTSIIKSSKMVIWNGPMGFFELDKFLSGSRAIAKAIASSKIYSIVGGGDTIALINKLKLFKKYSFVSTGGGAMLEFLAGKKLPGIEALKLTRRQYTNLPPMIRITI